MPDKDKLARLARYYQSRKHTERAGDVFFAAEDWENAMLALEDAADDERLAARYRSSLSYGSPDPTPP